MRNFILTPLLLASMSMANAGGKGENKTPVPEVKGSCPVMMTKGLPTAKLARAVTDLVNPFEMLANVRRLSGEDPVKRGYCLKNRCTLANRVVTRTFLIEKLKEYGFKSEEIYIETYDGAFSLASLRGDEAQSGKKAKIKEEVVNIYAEIRGKKSPGKFVELNAHYDTVHKSAPGADDNGSGVITNLEIARIFRTLKPDNSIRVVFADLEETGFVGTRMHVNNLKKKPNEDLVGAFVVDTIAYFPKEDPNDKPRFVVEIGTPRMHDTTAAYEKNALLANTVIDQMRSNKRHAEGLVTLEDALPGTTDLGAYWKGGYPAVLIAAIYEDPYINPGYHKETDTVEQFDLNFFNSIVEQIVESVARTAGINNAAIEANHTQVALRDGYTGEDVDYVGTKKAEEDKARAAKSSFFGGGKKGGSGNSNSWIPSKTEQRREAAVGQSLSDWGFDRFPDLIRSRVDKGELNAEEFGQKKKKGFFSSLWGEPAPSKPELELPQLGSAFSSTEKPYGSRIPTVTFYDTSLMDKPNKRMMRRYLLNSVEVLFPNKAFKEPDARSIMQVRIGTMVFGIAYASLDAAFFKPADFEGDNGVVMHMPNGQLKTNLAKFSQYAKAISILGGFKMAPKKMAFTFEDIGTNVFQLGTDKDAKRYTFRVEEVPNSKKSEYRLVETTLGFFIPLKTTDVNSKGKGTSIVAEVRLPSTGEYAVAVLRDFFKIDLGEATQDQDLLKSLVLRSEAPFSVDANTKYRNRSSLPPSLPSAPQIDGYYTDEN